MELNADTCYQALLAHDPRFDGVFFVGVGSTDIYCRTVCRAKTPRRENCSFYPSAAAAEKAGFRPCLRCRPELAPGNARIDAVGRLAAAAASRIEEGGLTESGVDDLAADLGVTGRHLRRAVRAEYGVSPIELAQTQRLLLAKRLLRDTRMPVIDVAFASGFASLRRFNALLKARYGLSPRALRGSTAAEAPQATLRCEVAYRPPLDWDSLLRFLDRRAIGGVEVVRGGKYLRTVGHGTHRGWIAVELAVGRPTLRVELSATLAPALSWVLGRVKRLFDLAAEPRRIAAQLGALAAKNPGLRVPGAFDGFELAVRAVLGQQVSVRAASTLAGRFARAFGEPIETPAAGLDRLWPTADKVVTLRAADIAALGVLPSRARSILALARAVAAGRLALDAGPCAERTAARLRALPGIGDWTAEYVAMRALAWPDAFPHADLGIRRALGGVTPARALALAEAWRPWRAYAALHLWNSLETTA
ncbi:MAG: DNA-3-methyladenine glycosylase 2 [Planctomycetes bacterium]|nr:DNA-3-methyladenine glycosylase 2 [Planctomycetota bacterium]